MACLPPELPYGSNNRRVEPILRLLRTARRKERLRPSPVLDLFYGETFGAGLWPVSCFFLLFTGVT
jgi:hypothetical protein